MNYNRCCTYCLDAECVNCGDCETKDVFECSSCEAEFHDEDDLHYGLCEVCQTEVKKKLAGYLAKEFDADEIGLIDEALEGIYVPDFISRYHLPPSK